MTIGLPVSRLIKTAVNLSPQQARFPNFSTVLLLTDNTVIDTVTRIASYSTLEQVGTAFGTDSPEYEAAKLWFGQKPSPTTFLIGRWAATPTAGQLFGGAIDAANRVIGPWNAINNGAFKITIDGVGPQEVEGLDFSGDANLNAVANTIESAFPGGTATCVWDAVNSRFVITSVAVGDAASISFLTAPDAGTDISQMMAARDGEGGFVAPGLNAQTALDTVVLFDNQFSNQWYGLVVPAATSDDAEAIAGYIEAANTPHYFGTTSMDGDTIVVGNDTCIAALLEDLGVDRSTVQYSSTNAYAVISYLARILTTDWAAQASTITLMYKDEPLVVAETLTETQADAVDAKNANVFVNYNNETAIIQYGKSASGQYTDSVIGVAWLAASLQAAAYQLLYSSKKVPQTDAGMHQIATAFIGVLNQAVNNGLIAPGTWLSQGFGQLKTGDFMPSGYYVYTPPISTQSAADRRARKSVAFQIAVKLGGAVHEVDVSIDVES